MGKTQNNLDLPVYLFHQGNNSKAYEIMGSHKVPGTGKVVFRVWAPHATAVSVVGDFNDWDPYNLRMEKISDGIWEATAPDGVIEEYTAYKYAIEARDGRTVMKADPYGYHMETRPGTASKFYDIDHCYTWNDDEWLAHRASTRIYDMPVNIYEVHAG
ncbi:MAG: 1,4-alpha-glucan branching enzyme, partial [Clostridia bacterium]|nr:1,4-alpha-glucan branching enzyme [Clostridia bacterium]